MVEEEEVSRSWGPGHARSGALSGGIIINDSRQVLIQDRLFHIPSMSLEAKYDGLRVDY